MEREVLIRKAKEAEDYNKSVLSSVPEKYHHYFLPIERNQVVAKYEIKLDEELKRLGYYAYQNKTFLKTSKLYLTVAGRNHMFIDWIEENNYCFTIENNLFEFMGKPFIKTTVTVFDSEGKVVRKAESTVPVNIGGSGVDQTNPFENAETSAVGRALCFLGIGQVSGVATFEEVVDAISRQEKKPYQPQQVQSSAVNANIPEINKYKIESVEPCGEDKAVLKVLTEDGEIIDLYVWGEVFEQINALQTGDEITAKTEFFKSKDGSSKIKLAKFKKVS